MAAVVGWTMYRRRQPGWVLYALLTFFVLPVGLLAAIIAIGVHPSADRRPIGPTCHAAGTVRGPL
jgi:hypothetical protein